MCITSSTGTLTDGAVTASEMKEQIEVFELPIHVTEQFLKALDTFGNCQRPVFSLGVSQHTRKITHPCENLNSTGR